MTRSGVGLWSIECRRASGVVALSRDRTDVSVLGWRLTVELRTRKQMEASYRVFDTMVEGHRVRHEYN